MVHLKTKEEISVMKEAGKRLKAVVAQLLPSIKAGMTTDEIDKRAENLILATGGKPSFKQVKGYYWTTCLPINEQVVHTPPSSRRIKQGDLLTVDIGLYYRKFHVDFATSFIVGDSKNQNLEKFLDTGRLALKRAIDQVKPGGYLGEISREIEKLIYGSGYYILHQLTGHGIGHELHEDPFIPGYLDQPVKKTLKIEPGLVIAIEVIYSMGTEEIESEKDNDWSIVTADRSQSACFEHTIAVTDEGPIILT